MRDARTPDGRPDPFDEFIVCRSMMTVERFVRCSSDFKTELRRNSFDAFRTRGGVKSDEDLTMI